MRLGFEVRGDNAEVIYQKMEEVCAQLNLSLGGCKQTAEQVWSDIQIAEQALNSLKVGVIVAFIVVLGVFCVFIPNFMVAVILVIAIDFVLINIVATYVYLEWTVDFVDSIFIILLILDSV